MKISKQIVTPLFKSTGFSYKAPRKEQRTLNTERVNFIRHFLKRMAEAYKKEEDGTHVLVFMVKSYSHTTHFDKKDFFRDGEAGETNRKSSKGMHLIMMHTITKYDPLCERDATYRPVDDILWTNPNHLNGKETNTPHSFTLGHPLSSVAQNNSEDRLTCKTLWVADSSTVDYHDNMNSNMFMQWVERCLIPTFNKLHPSKKMILILDNAPYRHTRAVPVLTSKSKKDTPVLMAPIIAVHL